MKLYRTIDWNAFPKGEAGTQLLADSSTGVDECIFTAVSVPEGKESPRTAHPAGYDKFYYTLEGTLGIKVGDSRQTVPAASMVYVPAGVTSEAWNGGSGPEYHVEMLVARPGDAPANEPVVKTVDWAQFDKQSSLSQNMVSRAHGNVVSTSFNVFKMPQGRGIGEDGQQHFHGFSHIYFVVEGTLKIRIGFQEHVVPAGSFCVIPPGMIHWTRNEGPGSSVNLNIRIPEATTPHMQGSPVQITQPEGRTPAG